MAAINTPVVGAILILLALITFGTALVYLPFLAVQQWSELKKQRTSHPTCCAPCVVLKHERLTLALHGLGGCDREASALQRQISTFPGVLRAHVNPLLEAAYFEFDPNRCTPRQILMAIRRASLHLDQPSA